MPLIENRTKLKLQAGELALGFGVHHLRTSATAMIAAAADHDWLFIDMEHGALSVHEATQLCIAAIPTGITPIRAGHGRRARRGHPRARQWRARRGGAACR